MSLVYGTKPLRLKYNEDHLRIDDKFNSWDGWEYDVGRYLGWSCDRSALFRLLRGKHFHMLKIFRPTWVSKLSRMPNARFYTNLPINSAFNKGSSLYTLR